MVFTADKDFLRDMSLTYYEALKKSGWKGEVDIMETEGKDGVLMEGLLDFFNEKI